MRLFKDRWIIGIMVLILAVNAVGGIAGARFFHNEMQRQIGETMRAQALQILKGYDVADQDREILRAAVQSDALEYNRIHGEFLMDLMEHGYQEQLRGRFTPEQTTAWIRETIGKVHRDTGLEGQLLLQVSERRNALDALMKQVARAWGPRLLYVADSPSELLRTGSLTMMVTGGTGDLPLAYARGVYHPKLDMAVVFALREAPEANTVGLLMERVQENLEHSLRMAVPTEDIIIHQESGYSFYSGRFGTDRDQRLTRILYDEARSPQSLSAALRGLEDDFTTLSIRTPDGEMQERYAYVRYDRSHRLYVVISRETADIAAKERDLIRISQVAGAVNILVTVLIAWLLLRRDTLEEEAPTGLDRGRRWLTLSFIVLMLLFLLLTHGLFRLQLFKQAMNEELREKLQVETVQMGMDYKGLQSETAQVSSRIRQADSDRTLLTATQMRSLIQRLEEDYRGPEQASRLLEALQSFNDDADNLFWLYDRNGVLLLKPRDAGTERDLRTANALWRLTAEEGLYGLAAVDQEALGQGCRMKVGSAGWTLIAFQPQEVLRRRLQGVEDLKRQRVDAILADKSIAGSAGVVDDKLQFIEYTYAQMKGRSVDAIRLKSQLTASQLLFTGESKFCDYVIVDPIDGRSKFRQSYIYHDAETGQSFFITQDHRRAFHGIDRRSSPFLGGLATATLGMLILCSGITLGRIFRTRRQEEEQ